MIQSTINIEEKPLKNVKQELILSFFLLCWLFFFARKGAIYQLGLYGLPLLTFIFPSARKTFFSIIKKRGLYIFSLSIIPSIISLFFNYFNSIQIDWDSSKDLLDIVWRIIIIPISITTYFIIAPDRREKSIIALSLAAFFYVISGILEILGYIPEKTNIRLSGILSGPNAFGLIMAFSAIISLWLVLNQKKSSKIYIAITISTFIASSTLLVLSLSRGSMVCMFIGCTIVISYALRKQPIKKILPIILTPLIILGYCTYYYDPGRVVNFFEDSARIQIWQHYITLFKENWLFGIQSVDYFAFVYQNTNTFSPHNIFLEVAVRDGIIALTCWVAFCVFIALKLIRFSSKIPEANLALAIFSMTLAAGFVDYSIYDDEIIQSPLAMVIAYTLLMMHKSKSYQFNSEEQHCSHN